MPPLRKVHFTYPLDILDDLPAFGDPGIWLELSTAPGLVGVAEADYPPVPTRGSRESRRATFEADLNAVMQATCEIRKNFADMVNTSTASDTRTDDDTVTRDLVAEHDCRYENSDGQVTDVKGDVDVYVIRVVTVKIPVVSINPTVLGAIEVSNAASGIQSV